MPEPKSSLNAEYVRRLADLLVGCAVGGRITYSEMSAAVGEDVQSRRYLIARAMKVANSATGVLFRPVRRVGYERIHASEASAVGRSCRERMRRAGKRASRAIGNSLRHANDVTDEQRLKAYSEQTHLGLLVQMSYDRHMPKLPEGSAPLSPDSVARATAEAMRAHPGGE